MSAANGNSRGFQRAYALCAALLLAVLVSGCGGGAPPKKAKRTVLLKTEAHDEKAGKEASQSVGAQMASLHST